MFETLKAAIEVKMSETCSSYDEITIASEPRSQGLKYLPHWPPVNIDFEDIIYTVENGTESEYKNWIISFWKQLNWMLSDSLTVVSRETLTLRILQS